MLTKRTVILAKGESGGYGVDPTPTAAANAIEAYDPDITIIPDMKERYPGNTDMSRYPELRGKTHFELKFSTKVVASGTRGTASRQYPLFEACGLDGAALSATSVTYTLISTAQVSCTIYAYIDGLLYKCLGCVGDMEIDLSAGEMGVYNWTFKALYAIPTQVTIVDPTFDNVTPLIVKGATMTFGGYAAIIEKLNLKLNNEITERPDFNSTAVEGIKGFQISGRNPEGSMTIEAVIRSTFDIFDYFHSRTVKALSFVLGTTAGNIITITASYGYCRAPKMSDRGGIYTFEISFQLARSTGNDEITIVET